uniref:Uncharacterized protein n=1 Tax=Oryza nivara TaxID=4536 RepID=A0A0E0HZD3_ORYNI
MSGHWCHRPISLTGASQAKPLRHQLRLAEPAGAELLLPPERKHAWPPPSRPFNHRSTSALSLFLSIVAREKKQKKGEKNGRKKKRHMTSGPLCTTVPQVLSASKELTWTQMAMLKPREILRPKARHD